jgi:hypothetical protein
MLQRKAMEVTQRLQPVKDKACLLFTEVESRNIPFNYGCKWYVDEKSRSHTTFESLAKAFLSFFQLPVHHDTGLDILLI